MVKFKKWAGIILKHNNDFIRCLVKMNNESSSVFVSGISQPVEISSQIYNKIINEIYESGFSLKL